jgi:hypothetical protein
MIDSFELMGHTITVKYGRVPREAWGKPLASHALARNHAQHLAQSGGKTKPRRSICRLAVKRDLSSPDHCAASHQIRRHVPTPIGLISRFSRKPSIVRFHV